jgi:hypothetical protein
MAAHRKLPRTQKQAAKEAGLSKNQEDTAVRVAKVSAAVGCGHRQLRQRALNDNAKLILLRDKSPQLAKLFEAMLDAAVRSLYPKGGAR